VAIVAGNYIELTAGNKGKLRLKLPRGEGKEKVAREWKGVNSEKGRMGNSGEAAREKVSCGPELSKQGAN